VHRVTAKRSSESSAVKAKSAALGGLGFGGGGKFKDVVEGVSTSDVTSARNSEVDFGAKVGQRVVGGVVRPGLNDKVKRPEKGKDKDQAKPSVKEKEKQGIDLGSLEEVESNTFRFCEWLGDLILENIYPGAPYEREVSYATLHSE